MLGTIQQVAGAFGTALVITLMTSRTNDRLDEGASLQAATIDGMQLAFLVSAVIAIGDRRAGRHAAEPSGRGPARRPDAGRRGR